MVLEEEFFPHGYGGYQKQGYGQDYYSKNGYGHKDDYYSDNSYYGNGSTMQMVRPYNITTPEPAKHFAVGSDGHRYHKESSGGHGKHHHQNNHHDHDHDHDLTYGHGFPGGGAHHHSDGVFGKTSHMQGGYNYGQQIHGYPKPTSPFGGGSYEYEREHGSYAQKEPGRYESTSYDDYYGEDRNRFPTPSFYGQASHISNYNNKNHHWATGKGDAEWISKGL